jgi:hypothetical protein
LFRVAPVLCSISTPIFDGDRPMRLQSSAIVLVLALLSCTPAATAEGESRDSMRVASWLVLGPVAQPLPAFGEQQRGKYDLARLLDATILPDLRIRPARGEGHRWLGGEALSWRTREADEQGLLELEAGGDAPQVAWLAVYIETDRWASAELKLLGSHPRRAWLDGEPIASGGIGTDRDAEVEATLKLEPGKHLL